jgi:prepilin-type N-terminal cleavage/methylation domain-containing protein
LKQRNAFTIVELLVVVAIISLLIAILLPALGRARDAALVTQSLGNLRNLAAANATYGADYSDRQFTLAGDDFGLAAGNCGTYLGTIGCPGQAILGWDDNGGLWGYWLGGGLCPPNYPGNCGNWIVNWPNEWNFTNGFFGYYRLPNCKPFNTYVNGRFYDRSFVAPKDKLTMERAEEGMGDPGEFTILPQQPGQVVFSTYVWSPAALWSPDVMSRNGFKQPNTLPGAWKCPSQGQAKYSELKTRMIEFYWLQNQDGGPTNPGFSGGYTPWYFNQGNASTPNAMFYDGHVAGIAVSEVMDADRRARAGWNGAVGAPPATGRGLWHTGTPLGANGFYQQLSFDMLADTSFHMLTTDGILGRDVLGAK